jgi:tRNA(Ile)-lysidine synthase
VSHSPENRLSAAFDAALDAILQSRPSTALAVALSGGLDSMALLHLAHAYCLRSGRALFAFHVHHGLSVHADDWLAHCRAVCAQLDIAFDFRRVEIEDAAKNGVEQAARMSRYRALGELCGAHGLPLLLTAHHQDDQAETVLLQLLRGSGMAGLSGMDSCNSAPELFGRADVVMARPLLAQTRALLAEYVAALAIAHIEDESNSDPRFARNALRLLVMPALAAHFPGFQQRLARSAQHAQAAQRLLLELAREDLARCRDGDCLDIAQLRLLSAERCANLLRHWFALRGLRMPAAAWLAQLREQALGARDDAQLCVTHPQCHVRRYRDKLFIDARRPGEDARTGKMHDEDDDLPSHGFVWDGVATTLRAAPFAGVLHFEQAAEGQAGFAADWLRQQALLLHFRSGGERLKLAANRPTKSVKYHYQANEVPGWERERLPMVSRVQGERRQLLFAAGIGMDCAELATGGRRIVLRWEADAA